MGRCVHSVLQLQLGIWTAIMNTALLGVSFSTFKLSSYSFSPFLAVPLSPELCGVTWAQQQREGEERRQ